MNSSRNSAHQRRKDPREEGTSFDAEVTEPAGLTISIDDTRRLLVDDWESNSRRLVTVTAQYLDRARGWKIARGSLMLTPDVARQLAPALLVKAATIDGAPEDPMPTAEDRELSRMP